MIRVVTSVQSAAAERKIGTIYTMRGPRPRVEPARPAIVIVDNVEWKSRVPRNEDEAAAINAQAERMHHAAIPSSQRG